MLPYLEEIQNRLAVVNLAKPSHEPLASVDPKERVLGTASDTIKKLFIVWRSYMDEHDQLLKEYGEKLLRLDSDAVSKMTMNHNHLHDLKEISRMLFWGQMRIEFGDKMGRDNRLGIAKGWQVVVDSVDGDDELAGLTIISMERLGGLSGLLRAGHLRGFNL